ncbi:MAG: hypothetical protein AB8F74_06635, partial [Saprospiraceae bacterium]
MEKMKCFFVILCTLMVCFGCAQNTYNNKEKLKLNEHLYVVKSDNGYDAIDSNNNFLFPLSYDEIQPLNEQSIKYFKVRNGDKFGLIDFNG